MLECKVYQILFQYYGIRMNWKKVVMTIIESLVLEIVIKKVVRTTCILTIV